MKHYRDLNLKEIREYADLDFARYTYDKGQDFFHHGPIDMPALYWKNRQKPEKVLQEDGNASYMLNGEPYDYDNISFLLFKNIGSERIRNRNQVITDFTCISYNFRDDEQKKKACQQLLNQLDEDYVLAVSKDKSYCLVIYKRYGINLLKAKEKESHRYKFYDFGDTIK